MSGPVTTTDADPVGHGAHPPPATVEITESREARVGSVPVRRALPRRARRTVAARRDSDHMGADLALMGPTTGVPLRPDFEHAVVVLDGAVSVDDHTVDPGRLAYLGAGRDEIRLAATAPARALLIGGVPFDEPVLMWWNFVARTTDEITAAHEAWTAEEPRFGTVASALRRIPVAPPPWSTGAGQ